MCVLAFFFNDTATTEIYTLSLHDALPILCRRQCSGRNTPPHRDPVDAGRGQYCLARRSEEHTSELQSRQYLVCRLLLEKKNITMANTILSIHPSFVIIDQAFLSY